jgi:hypothetical protein
MGSTTNSRDTDTLAVGTSWVVHTLLGSVYCDGPLEGEFWPMPSLQFDLLLPRASRSPALASLPSASIAVSVSD